MQIDSLKNCSVNFFGKYRVEVPKDSSQKSDLVSLSRRAEDYGQIMEELSSGSDYITIEVPDDEDENTERSLELKGFHFDKMG